MLTLAFTPQANFPAHNLHIHWIWRWWDQIQAIFLNHFYFKKTKWKKLSKFLAEKQTEGIITIKEPKKGVETITDINQDHPKILQFKVIKYEGLVQFLFFKKNLVVIFRLTITNLFYLFVSLPELKCKFGELILKLAQNSHTKINK